MLKLKAHMLKYVPYVVSASNVLFRVHGYVCKNKQQLNSIIKAKIINFAL